MPFDHVPQDRDVDVVAQQLMARRRVQTLGLGEAAGVEPVHERAFQTHAFPARPDDPVLRERHPPMATGLLERERMDEHRPRPPPQRRRDLSRQQVCRRPGHEHLRSLLVEQPPHEPLPSRHELDLVEAPQHRRIGLLGGKQAGVLVENDPEVVRGESDQPLVLERQVGRKGQRAVPGRRFAANLMQERGLPGAAHPDDGRGFSRKPDSTVNVARRVRGRGGAQEFGKLLAEQLPKPGGRCCQSISPLDKENMTRISLYEKEK